MEELNLKSPAYYINRELSLLEFNYRVLEIASDKDLPLLERLRYLCISSSNLDEFFEVRVGSLKQQIELGLRPTGADGLSPEMVLTGISQRSHELVEQQYSLLNDELIPQLESEGIHFIRRNHWDKKQRDWLSQYFDDELMFLLSPLGLDPSHPFPNVINKSLNFAVNLKGRNAFGREVTRAIVQAPRSLPRIVRLPEEIAPTANSFVFLSSILHAFIDRLFPGLVVEGCYQFRLTRNSNMYVDEEEIDDLLKAMQGELPHRQYGAAVRLEVAEHCPEEMVSFLLDHFELSRRDLYQVNGPVNLNRLMKVYDLVDRPDLCFEPFSAGMPLTRRGATVDMFNRIRKGDVLLHHPYEAFTPLLDFVKQASLDDNVLALKVTLYRTGKQAALVDSLVRAARNGKDVTAVVELRARFDEAANIDLTNRLQQAGVHVVYGVVGYKTHAKLCMVVRRDRDGLRRYVHLGTGNYHAGTAKAYTDFGLFTCAPDIGDDVHRVFQMLTGLGRVRDLNCLLESPFTLHRSMVEKINRERDFALKGKKAHIMCRMNSLIEPEVIEAMYAASQAGVKIDLVVRGICCLRPGIKGVSENIHVRSVMGRFLEHPRVFYFYNNGKEEMYGSSADWMPRNFFRRVETAFPVRDKELLERVRHEAFTVHLQDNSQAWVLAADGNYERQLPKEGEERFSAQEALMHELGEEGVRRSLLRQGIASKRKH